MTLIELSLRLVRHATVNLVQCEVISLTHDLCLHLSLLLLLLYLSSCFLLLGGFLVGLLVGGEGLEEVFSFVLLGSYMYLLLGNGVMGGGRFGGGFGVFLGMENLLMHLLMYRSMVFLILSLNFFILHRLNLLLQLSILLPQLINLPLRKFSQFQLPLKFPHHILQSQLLTFLLIQLQ